MPKPPTPTQQEMRDRCRDTYGHYSNISRWRLIEQYGAADTEHVNRAAAEVLEAEFLAKPPAEQDVDLDWYIPRYLGQLRRPHGKQYFKDLQGDPDFEHIKWALMGYKVQTWRPKRICGCSLKGTSNVLEASAAVDTWLHTFKTCPEHSATEQVLWDTIHGESARFSGALSIIGSLIDEAASAAAVLSFTTARLSGTDERVLEVAIAGATNPQRSNVQGAVDVQFGAGTILVS